MQCTLCNELIEHVEIEFEEAYCVNEEYWHADCFAEYFGDGL